MSCPVKLLTWIASTKRLIRVTIIWDYIAPKERRKLQQGLNSCWWGLKYTEYILWKQEKVLQKGLIWIYEVHTISFQKIFVWAILLIVHTWNSSPLRSNLLRQQCTCTIPTTSGIPHGSTLEWVCQWPSSQPLSSPQLSHNDSLWAWGISKSHREQGLDYREGEQLSWCPSWSNSLWRGWSCGLV